MIVVLLALTGLALNHENDLDFVKGTVRSETVLNLYGLEPQGAWVHFSEGPHSCASLEHRIYLDGAVLTTTEKPLIGVIHFQHFLALATSDRLLLLDAMPHGDPPQILDQMDSASLPGTLSRIGRGEAEALVVETERGAFVADANLLKWQPHSAESVVWSEASEPTAEQRSAILAAFRGEGLPRARVIADLHSGRIFGRYGPLLMDASAVILLLLVATGIMGSGLGRRRRGD